MVDSFTPPARRALNETWPAVLVILTSVVFAFLAASGEPGVKTNERILTAVQLIDTEHASLQRDILQSRAGLLRNYDPLNRSIRNLHESTAGLHADLVASEVGDRTRLENMVSDLQRSIASDEQLVESFKSQNALLQNSLAIFTELLDDLHRSPVQETQRTIAASADLGNAMMRFSLNADSEAATDVHLLLDSIDKSNWSSIKDVLALTAHGRIIVSSLPAIQKTMGSIQKSSTSARAQALQVTYLQGYALVQSQAVYTRFFLGAVSVLLCLFVLVLIYRLRLQTERTRRRLSFERAVTEMKNGFSNVLASTPVDIPLQAFSTFFNTSSSELRLIDLALGDTVELYCDGASLTESNEPIFQDFVARLLDSSCQSGEGKLFYYTRLEDRWRLPFACEALSGGAVASLRYGGKMVAIMVVRFADNPRRSSKEEAEFYRLALEAIVEAVEKVRTATERIHLETRLEQSQRLEAVGTLAGGIAHEFNNILGAILGYSEMALDTIRQDTPTRRYVRQILSAATRAQQIIDQILSLSRRREREIMPFDVVGAITDVLPLLEVSGTSQINLSTVMPTRPAVIMGQPIELQQIIINLCRNAVEASGERPEIAISVDIVASSTPQFLSNGELPPGRYVKITVTDAGRGISEAVLPHIFEPFYTTRALVGGTGLGLATVHGNVMSLHGQVNVLSIIGRGTAFELFFPESKEKPVASGNLPGGKTDTLGKGEIVVCISPEADFGAMLEEKLAALGYEPVGFRSWEEFLSSHKAGKITSDLLLVDVRSVAPELDGPALDRLVPSVRKVFILDSEVSGGLRESRLNAYPTIKRPVSSKRLAELISRTLRLGA